MQWCTQSRFLALPQSRAILLALMKRSALMTKNRLVYSTETGQQCPQCKATLARCRCDDKPAPPTTDGWVRLQRTTKGRGGKSVTLITGLGLSADQLKELAKPLKQHCGVGGTVKGFDIEIQGEDRAKIQEWLEGRGFKVKIAGG